MDTQIVFGVCSLKGFALRARHSSVYLEFLLLSCSSTPALAQGRVLGPSQGPLASKLLMTLNFLLVTFRLSSAFWVGNGSCVLCVFSTVKAVALVLGRVTGHYIPSGGLKTGSL